MSGEIYTLPYLSYIERHRIRKVLIVKLTSLGDVVHALPTTASLKKAFPFLKLYWVVEDRCAPVLENHPLLESVIVYPRKDIQENLSKGKGWKVLTLLLNLRRSLKALSVDLSIDLQGLAKSALMVWMAGAPYRLGCSGLKEFSYLFSQGLSEGGDLHAVDRNLKVAEFLGAERTEPEFVLGGGEKEKRWVNDFFGKQGNLNDLTLVGIQVGASFPQKCWPIIKMVALVELISRLPYVRIVLLGDQNDRRQLAPFLSRIPRQVINTTGELSLSQLMALIGHCRLFIGADTGPLHLAAARGLPVIALCGADDPKFTGPYGNGHRVHYKKFPCSPCNKTPVCQGRYDCMAAIEVEEVMESVMALLDPCSTKG